MEDHRGGNLRDRGDKRMFVAPKKLLGMRGRRGFKGWKKHGKGA